MDLAFDFPRGYGDFGNVAEVLRMKKLDDEGKKAHVKKLWKKNPVKYEEWKSFCIARNRLPDFFGTRDNPIPIDESKL